MHTKSIVVLDFGGQYAHLIGRRVRECGVYAEILPAETSAKDLKGCAGIILSGGPQSVYSDESPKGDPALFDMGVPVLGICYGHQWLSHVLGGTVKSGSKKEYGKTGVKLTAHRSPLTALFRGLPRNIIVWMSHGDEVVSLPDGFETIASSDSCKNATIANSEKNFFGLQFHPEVTHTEYGKEIIKNFVDVCDTELWSIQSHEKEISAHVIKEVGDNNVFMLVSGGVDSTVAFALLNKILGPDRVQGLLIDTGLMRKDEVRHVQDAFTKIGVKNLHTVDASEEFFTALKDIYDPEEKRKIIGEIFLKVQRTACASLNLEPVDAHRSPLTAHRYLLGQGTIYPDIIETGGTKYASHIKTHHNRVEAVQTLIDAGLVIEPLKELYKDEVRVLGEELGLPHELVWRHPFPGPGLGVRILCAEKELRITNYELRINVSHAVLPVKSVGVQGDGRTYRHAVVLFSKNKFPTEEHWELATEIPNTNPDINRLLLCTSHTDPIDFVFTPCAITKERADLLREADHIVDEEIRSARLYEQIWQFPVVLLPVGIQEGGQSIVLRPFESEDVMSANAYHLPEDVLICITERLMSLDGIDIVFFDMTSKPPATIEWE